MHARSNFGGILIMCGSDKLSQKAAILWLQQFAKFLEPSNTYGTAESAKNVICFTCMGVTDLDRCCHWEPTPSHLDRYIEIFDQAIHRHILLLLCYYMRTRYHQQHTHLCLQSQHINIRINMWFHVQWNKISACCNRACKIVAAFILCYCTWNQTCEKRNATIR